MARATSTADDEVLVRDVFPADVLLADGRLVREAHVFVTSSRMLVWTKTAAGAINDPIEIAVAAQVAPSRNTLGINETLHIETATGTAHVNRAQGCGCGSPLKALAAPADWVRR
jgi:hypothetical protein